MHSTLPAKFGIPGQETASVLQLSKRPRLRAKDIAHRQSLGPAASVPNQHVPLTTGSPVPVHGYTISGQHELPQVSLLTPPRFTLAAPTQRVEENFLIMLLFGQRKVGVSASRSMSISELRVMAAQVAGLAPGDVALMRGDVLLHHGNTLGDYLTESDCRGTIIQVVSSVGITTTPAPPAPRSTGGGVPPLSPGTAGSDGTSSSSGRGDPNVFLIHLVYESGQIQTQPVSPDTLLGQVRRTIAMTAQVSPEEVFLVFNNAFLDSGRKISDPPPIVRGSSIYVFFSDSTQLLASLASYSLPPAPPGFVHHHGPALPPGFSRSTPNPAVAVTPAPAPTPGRSNSDKLRGSFKCPKFMGEARNWKAWHKGFVRFVSIQQLDYIIADDFSAQPKTSQLAEDNKLVYYILEEAVSSSKIAAKYVRRAPEWDGNAAYIILYDGYAFSGPAEATLLLNALGNFRFGDDETASELCLRLQELFEDLEAVPGDSAMSFGNTQKINYLLSAIRHERSLGPVYVQIQTDQLRGRITFDQACEDLRARCEAMRADDLLNTTVRSSKVRGYAAKTGSSCLITEIDDREASPTLALITTENKRKNGRKSDGLQVECLAKGCSTLTPPHLRLCRLHFHECIAGKHPFILLKTGDRATYDATTSKIVYPHLLASAPGKKGAPLSKIHSVRTLVANPATAGASN
jgi:hypothetical protein